MTFPISPGVYSREIDLSTAPETAVATSGQFVGKFVWGPVNVVTSVSSEPDLVLKFGKPTIDTNVDFLQATSFLAYSSALNVVRLGKEGQSKNATSAGIAPSVLNDDDYSAAALTGINYIAKYVGEAGNSLAVATCDSASLYEGTLPGSFTFPVSPRSKLITYVPALTEELFDYFNVGDLLVVDGVQYVVQDLTATVLTIDRIYAGAAVPLTVRRRWAYAGRFNGAPATGRAHIVVVDTLGKLSDSAGSVLEVYENVSSVSTDKNADGTSAYFESVLAASQYIRVGALGISGTNSTTRVELLQFFDGDDAFEMIDTDEKLAAYDLFASKETVSAPLFIGGGLEDSVAANYLLQNIYDVRKDGLVFFSPKLASLRTASNKAAAVVADRNLLPATSFGVMNGNWKYMYDRYNDVFVWVPCAADEAGIYARVDRERDPWYAAAGAQRGVIKNAVKLAWNPTETERDTIYQNDVNPIVDFPSTGPVVFGQKTLLGVNSALSRVNVRRLVNLIETVVAEFAESVLFEFNDTLTQSQFKSKVDAFLRDIKGRRGLDDFLVICDSTVNTPSVVQNNQFVGQIYLKPAYAIEFVRLDFVVVNASTSFTEVVGTV